MNEHWDLTLSAMQQDVARLEQELADQKRAVNVVCKAAKRPLLYPDADKSVEASVSSIRRDQWYGQGISTAIREYLAMRRTANLGPATVNEIYDALLSGGYSFEAKDAENAKRGLRISLTKNTSIFHRLPDGSHFGLLDWYPEAKVRKPREAEARPIEDEETDQAVTVEPIVEPAGFDRATPPKRTVRPQIVVPEMPEI